MWRSGMLKRYGDIIMGLLMLVMIILLAGHGVDVVKEAGAAAESKEAQEEIPKARVVVIDSGHGGNDPGKVGINEALEKDINLNIALKVKDLLTENGVTVIMTRETDAGLYRESDSNKKIADLKQRCKIIEDSGAAVTVSIHQNSYHLGSVSGPQVFYYKNSEEGKKLAEFLQESLAAASNQKSRGVKSNDNYYLLLNVSTPVVIAECGFLSNWEDAQKLVTEEFQQKLAEALCEGILAYLDS